MKLYAHALGRAVVLAQNFENNAKFALGIAELDRASSQREFASLEDLSDLGGRVMKRWLGEAVRKTRSLKEVPPSQAAVLSRGVKARNYLVHEAAAGLSYDREANFADRLAEFREMVWDLAAADNLASCWSFEIQEKSAAPSHIQSHYGNRAAQWVLEPVEDLLACGSRSSLFPN